jgi:hypothetical protein
MKKLLSIVCCAVLLLSVSSCTKKYITPNLNQTINYDLASSAWTVTSPTVGVSYQASLNVPIDGDSVAIDGIILSISYDGGDTYEQVPEVYNNVSYSYTYNKGNITLYAQAPGGGLPSAVPDPVKVKVVVVYSNPTN